MGSVATATRSSTRRACCCPRCRRGARRPCCSPARSPGWRATWSRRPRACWRDSAPPRCSGAARPSCRRRRRRTAPLVTYISSACAETFQPNEHQLRAAAAPADTGPPQAPAAPGRDRPRAVGTWRPGGKGWTEAMQHYLGPVPGAPRGRATGVAAHGAQTTSPTCGSFWRSRRTGTHGGAPRRSRTPGQIDAAMIRAYLQVPPPARRRGADAGSQAREPAQLPAVHAAPRARGRQRGARRAHAQGGAAAARHAAGGPRLRAARHPGSARRPGTRCREDGEARPGHSGGLLRQRHPRQRAGGAGRAPRRPRRRRDAGVRARASRERQVYFGKTAARALQSYLEARAGPRPRRW